MFHKTSNNTLALLVNGSTAFENITLYVPYEIVWTPKVVFHVTTLIVVMVMTVIGNTLLLTLILRKRSERRRRVNVFIVNLAIGDLTVCFVTMTTEILFIAFGEWVLGAVACKLIVYGQMVTLASATFLLTAMSIDRYQVIVRPLQSLSHQPKIWRKVAIAWILAFTFASPQMFIFVQTNEGVHSDGKVKYMCKSKGYTTKWQRKLYFTFLATYILVIPTIIMSFCYINIIKVVWSRDKSQDLMASSPERLRKTSIRVNTTIRFQNRRTVMCPNRLSIPHKFVSSSKRSVIKMTLSVIIGFLVCWTPYFVVSLIRIYSDYKIKLRSGLIVAETMALIHSALNPILYGAFHANHKALLKRIMCSSKNGDANDDSELNSDETSSSVLRHESVYIRLIRGIRSIRTRKSHKVIIVDPHRANEFALIHNGVYKNEESDGSDSCSSATRNFQRNRFHVEESPPSVARKNSFFSAKQKQKSKGSRPRVKYTPTPLVIENKFADQEINESETSL